MTIGDLSLVTKTLQQMLEQRVSLYEGDKVQVRAVPPDILTEDSSDELIGLYLYHATEEPYFKSQAPTLGGSPQIQLTPMALNLHYQITARSADTEQGVFHEQRYMSIAMKAMHDFAILTEGSVVDPAKDRPFYLSGLDGKDIRLQIALQPISHMESLQFWNTSSKHPRFSAYYVVSVVMLDPERATSRTSRVLSYGVQSFVGTDPHLDGSVSSAQLTFGGVTRKIELRPAVLSIGDPTARATFYGSGFVGDAVALQLRSRRFAEQTGGSDTAEDPTWPITNTATTVDVSSKETMNGLVVFPGMYSARIRVRSTKDTPAGPRAFDITSNETPFVMAPRIDAVVPKGSGFTLEGWRFALPPDASATAAPLDIELYIGGERLLQVDPTKPLADRQFHATAEALEFLLATKPVAPVGVRVVVDGAESMPFTWVVP
ncbi:hypothetical protein BH09MYX1_BH09MYX1_08510 [soil metagenome]